MSAAACRLGSRPAELPRATTDDFRSRVIVRIGIVHGGVEPLLVDRSRAAFERAFQAAAGSPDRQTGDKTDDAAAIHASIPEEIPTGAGIIEIQSKRHQPSFRLVSRESSSRPRRITERGPLCCHSNRLRKECGRDSTPGYVSR